MSDQPKTQTKKQLADMVREIRIRTGHEKYVVEDVLRTFLTILGEWLMAGITFGIYGFGLFRTRVIKSHLKRNMRTFSNPTVGIDVEVPDATHPLLQFSTRFKAKFKSHK